MGSRELFRAFNALPAGGICAGVARRWEPVRMNRDRIRPPNICSGRKGFRQMLRAFFLSITTLCAIAMPAFAGAELGDDVATCRERQDDLKARQDACERVIAAGQ